MEDELKALMSNRMVHGGRPVAARLQAALALLERLRKHGEFTLASHLSAAKSGLISHETFGNLAHERLNLQPINRNHGRRSSNLQDWGQPLIDIVRNAGYKEPSAARSKKVIDAAQYFFATHLRHILEAEPIEVRLHGRSAESVITEVLEKADEKGKPGDIAQYLVGAKLVLRFGVDITPQPANVGDRKSRRDADAKCGDFEIENAVIEVAMGFPDDVHVSKIEDALERRDCEVWLIARGSRAQAWRTEIDKMEPKDAARVVVAPIESFLGQNISEIAEFSARNREQNLRKLFEIYNSKWNSVFGTPGTRIDAK